MRSKVITFIVFLIILSVPGYSQEIINLAKNGDLEQIKVLIKKDPGLKKSKDNRNCTLLHFAANGGHMELVRYLLSEGADINAQDLDGDTPLHWVTYKPKPAVAEILIKNGADLNIKNRNRRTPIFVAVRDVRNIELVRLFLSNNANLNITDIEGWNLLKTAVFFGLTEMVDIFIAGGIDIPVNGEEGKEMLHIAAGKGQHNLINEMIKKGADVESRINFGTVLHSSVKSGNTEIVNNFISRGFDLNERNIYGLTPLHIAVSEGKLELIELLLKKGADINIKNYEGKTPFNLAKDLKLEKIEQFLTAEGAEQIPENIPVLKGEYLGMKKPGKFPELFAPGLCSNDLTQHSPASFSPDGQEVYWSQIFNNPFRKKVMFMNRINGKWSAPAVAPFSLGTNEGNPVFSPDGSKIYFSSWKKTADLQRPKHIIQYVNKSESGWSGPLDEDNVINSISRYWHVSQTSDGTLYFASGRDGAGIYYSKKINNKFINPVKINAEFSGGTPFIAPDESYMIFSMSGGENNSGGIDLFISYRKKDNTWSNAINLGERINSRGTDIWPVVSPDGKYLFFVSSRNGGNQDIYWVSAEFIIELKQENQ